MGKKGKLKMDLNKKNCELLKNCGHRYLVVQKPKNIIRSTHIDLKSAVSEVFGFSMSNVSVEIYDTTLDRFLKPKEYENETKEVLEYQKKMGWLS